MSPTERNAEFKRGAELGFANAIELALAILTTSGISYATAVERIRALTAANATALPASMDRMLDGGSRAMHQWLRKNASAVRSALALEERQPS